MYVNAIQIDPSAWTGLLVVLLVCILLGVLSLHALWLAVEQRIEELETLRRSHLHVLKEFLTLKRELEKHIKANTNDVYVLK